MGLTTQVVGMVVKAAANQGPSKLVFADEELDFLSLRFRLTHRVAALRGLPTSALSLFKPAGRLKPRKLWSHLGARNVQSRLSVQY
jgi:hypothetical protein